ncbi:hypothetical protein ABUK73_14970 [Agrobacterium sp. BA1120]|uniref:hypothetical protein n=1 Tax=Agrobacterium sp. BA1120 TaxID=3228927 RepID=UPI00336AE315
MELLRFGEPQGNSSPRAISARINSSASLTADLSRILLDRALPLLNPDHGPLVEDWNIESRMVPMLTGYFRYQEKIDLCGEEWLSFTAPLELLSVEGGVVRSMERWYRLGKPSPFAKDMIRIWAESDGK